MSEEWKIIEEFPDYSICIDGKVRNNKTGRLLNPGIAKTGYYRVCLTKDKKDTMVRLHRILVTAFIPNPDKKPFVDHINRIKTDNRLENLRWATVSENTLNADPRETNTGEPYISTIQIKETHQRYYQVCGKKRFKTLEEAINYRDMTIHTS